MGYVLIAVIFTCFGFVLYGFLSSGKMSDLEYEIKGLNETVNAQQGRLDFYDKTKDKSIDIISNKGESE